MAERPILFSGPMVRALLNGRKTQTRRIAKPPAKWAERFPICKPSVMKAGHETWWWDGVDDRVGASQICPYGVPGDTLWVKETWHPRAALSDRDLDIRYAADGALRTIKDGEFGERDWTMPKAAARGNVSPLFMPRWASRLTLAITKVRIESLQDISERDARAEGLQVKGPGFMPSYRGADALPWRPEFPRDAFADLWESIHGSEGWHADPWVWAITFDVRTRT